MIYEEEGSTRIDPDYIYRQEIEEIPLLTFPELYSLAKIKDQGLGAAELLTGLVIDPDGMPYESLIIERLNQEMELGRQAEEKIILANLRLVAAVAIEYQNCGLHLADLIQAGNIGLMKAVKGYDWTQGNQFSTYAIPWIKGGIIRAIQETGRTISIPTNLAGLATKLEKIQEELTAFLGREPTIEEILGDCQTPIAQEKAKYLLTGREPLDLDEMVEQENPRLVNKGDDSNMIADILDIKEAMLSLTLREQQAVKLRENGSPYQEIGALLGNITGQRAHQITKGALEKLKQQIFYD